VTPSTYTLPPLSPCQLVLTQHHAQTKHNMKAVFDRHPTSSQESDYGGDFTQEEEELLGSLLTQYNSQVPTSSIPIEISADVSSEGSVVLHSTPRSFASVEALEELVQSGAFPAAIQLSASSAQGAELVANGEGSADGTAEHEAAQ